MKPSWKHSVLHFHPKFPNCWADLCGIDPCSLWKAWWLFPLQQHAQKQSKWRAGRFLGFPSLLPQAVTHSQGPQGSWHRWDSAWAGTQPLCKASPAISILQSRNGVSELPKWSSCSRRERGIFMFGVIWLHEGIEGFFFSIFNLNYEAPLKTAYLSAFRGVLPAANYTQVCTPNSFQTSVSPFAPCCLWPGVGTVGWYLCPYRCWCQKLLPVWSNQEWNVTHSYSCHIQTSPGYSSSLCCLQDLSEDHSFPSTPARSVVPSLPSSCCAPWWVMVPRVWSHTNCPITVAPSGTCISFSALSWTDKTQLLHSGRVN